MLEKTLESPLGCKEVKPVNSKVNQSWIFIGKTDDEAEAPIVWPPDVKSQHWKRPWCWERLKAGGGDNRGQNGWMASLTRWTWVLSSFGRWGSTGKPGVLLSLGSEVVGHDWVTKQLLSVAFVTSCFPGCTNDKEPAIGLIPELGRYPGEVHGNPLKYSCLENPLDIDACWARVAKSWPRLKQLSTQHNH